MPRKSATWETALLPPKEGMLWIFSPEKSDGFGRDRTRELCHCYKITKNSFVVLQSVADSEIRFIFIEKGVFW